MFKSGEDSRIRGIACKIPVPLAGLMLGLASAGNMLPNYRVIFGVLSAFVLGLLIIRIVFDATRFREELRNPAVAGTVGTIPMGVSILSTFTKPALPDISYAIWLGAVLVHVALIIYFTRRFMLKHDIRRTLPCYFIVYCGIAVEGIAASTFGAFQLGQILFWFGLISYFVLLPLIFYTTSVVKSLPEPLIPTIAIFAAPASLFLAAYLKTFESKDILLVAVLFAFSIVSYFAVLLYLPRMLRLKFYPSCTAFTFPMVISAIATGATYSYLVSLNYDFPVLKYISYVEIAVALILISYVLVRYADHFLLKRLAKPS